jgi:hypothetical protein
MSIETIIYLALATPFIAALAYEVYDWRTGNHPFQHMSK